MLLQVGEQTLLVGNFIMVGQMVMNFEFLNDNRFS